MWRTEPTTVEKLADDLWLAEKFQSNPEIAGSPRNSFRASVGKNLSEGRALNWRTEPTTVEKLADDLWLAEKFQSNPEIAGSPRNSFRASVGKNLSEGRALNV